MPSCETRTFTHRTRTLGTKVQGMQVPYTAVREQRTLDSSMTVSSTLLYQTLGTWSLNTCSTIMGSRASWPPPAWVPMLRMISNSRLTVATVGRPLQLLRFTCHLSHQSAVLSRRVNLQLPATCLATAVMS